jgi:hypothetical protein
MNDLQRTLLSLTIGAPLALVGCGGGADMPMGPGAMGPGGAEVSPTFMSVSPGGGAMGVPVGTPLEFHWGAPMGVGMEQFVDLHLGALEGPVVPIAHAWSAARTALVCTPVGPLAPGTQYTVHVGGGMVDFNGQIIDMEHYGPGFGGQWITGTGQPGTGGSGGGHHGGAHHGGQPWGGMGPGWQHPNGSYGMAFTFTTG